MLKLIRLLCECVFFCKFILEQNPLTGVIFLRQVIRRHTLCVWKKKQSSPLLGGVASASAPSLFPSRQRLKLKFFVGALNASQVPQFDAMSTDGRSSTRSSF